MTLFPLIPGIAKALDLKVDRGALVVELLRDGPAYKAGLKGSTRMLQVGNVIRPVDGDVIVAVNREFTST